MKDNWVFFCITCIAVMMGIWMWHSWTPQANPDLAQLRADIRDLRSQLYEMRVQEIDTTWQKCALKERSILSLLDAQATLFKEDEPIRYRSIMNTAFMHHEELKALEK